MKKILIITISLIALILFSGCTSYDRYIGDCERLHQYEFQQSYDAVCYNGSILVGNSVSFNCTKYSTDRIALRNYCFERFNSIQN